MKCPVVSFEVSVGLAWLWAACLLMLKGVFLLCWRMCDISCTGKLLPPGWSLVLVWVWRLSGEVFPITVPWNQEFSDVPKFWS